METQERITGIKGIIFDYGGTLDTDGEHWSHIIWDAWQNAGIACDYPHFREAYVYAERELARVRLILPHHDFHDLLKIKIRIELEWMAHQNLFPAADVEPMAGSIARECYDKARSNILKAIPVLRQLKEHFPLVLVSNFYGNLEKVLDDFGIRNLFQKVIESAVAGVRKPDPAIFEMGVRALGLPAGECLVVGDSYRKDIQPALHIGCQALWLKGKGWDDEAENIEYPQTITTLAGIIEKLALAQ